MRYFINQLQIAMNAHFNAGDTGVDGHMYIGGTEFHRLFKVINHALLLATEADAGTALGELIFFRR
ncbi:Uncharacterised protein [Serratia fonticola]|nr:Uncharacterised protein [Serratia fonticola]